LRTQAATLYRLYDKAGELLYIGITSRQWRARPGASQQKALVAVGRSHDVRGTPESRGALVAERSATVTEKPRYNTGPG